MSAFGELRLETCFSVLPLFAPSSPFPLPHIRFMCCWLPSSPGLDPELPPSPFIWFEAAGSLAGNPLTPTLKHSSLAYACTGMFVVCAHKHIQYCSCIHTHTYICIYTHTCTHTSPPAFLFPGVLLIDSARSCKGLWWKTGVGGPGEGWQGLRPGRGRVRKRAVD